MNELLVKLRAQVEDLNAKQKAALTASEAEGVTDEARAGHLAEFDRLQAQKEKTQASLKRAEQLERDQAAAEAAANAPRREPVVQDVFNPHAADENRIVIPARAKRHGVLEAFKGREKEAYMSGVWLCGALCAHPGDVERAIKYRNEARKWGLDFHENGNRAAPEANLTGLSNQSGGYFVPEIIDTSIIEITQQYGVLRQLAEVVPMTSDTKTSPRWSQAMIAYWISRGQKPNSSDPAWNAIQLIARDLAAMTKIARQLDEDSLVDLAEKVVMNIARAFALAEDNAGFNGDWSATYGGITGILTALGLAANAACVKQATGHTTPGALVNADFQAVMGAAPNYLGADYRWYCHKQFYWQSMANLQLTAGGNRVDTVAGGPNTGMYLGSVVQFVNVMPSAPTTGQIGAIYADLKLGVKVGDRRGKTVQAGYENDDFTRQLMTILGTERVDVNVHTVADPLGDPNAPGGPIMALKLG